jgi:hypothetical protein
MSLDANMCSNHKQEMHLWCESPDFTALIENIALFAGMIPRSLAGGKCVSIFPSHAVSVHSVHNSQRQTH